MPCATLPDVDDVLSLVFHTRKPPLVPTQFCPVVCFGVNRVRFFTDGTCKNPAVPYARHAAWSLIHDVAATHEQREQSLLCWRVTKATPPGLRLLDQGVVPGHQTISRAELCAALQAIRHGKLAGGLPILIVTDSSYVVSVIQQFQAGLSRRLLHASANVDLLRLLQEVWYDDVQVQKVKSHQDPDEARDANALWDILGNQAADEACELAIAADLTVVRDMIGDAASGFRAQSAQLQLVYRYFLEKCGHAAAPQRAEYRAECYPAGPPRQ